MKIAIEISDEQEIALGILNAKSNRDIATRPGNEEFAASLITSRLDEVLERGEKESRLSFAKLIPDMDPEDKAQVEALMEKYSAQMESISLDVKVK